MAVLIAATLLVTPMAPPLSNDFVVGAAAHYAPGYDNGGWDAIIAKHMAWGQIDPATFTYSPDGYYCVQPDHALGDRLVVVNAMTGAAIVCTIADAVAPRDEAHWRANAVIELSWAAFCAVDATDVNRVVVWEEVD